MQPEEKAVNLDTAKKLKDAGFPQNTERIWIDWANYPVEPLPHWCLVGKESESDDCANYAAPDTQEIGALLPAFLSFEERKYWLHICKDEFEDGHNEWYAEYVAVDGALYDRIPGSYNRNDAEVCAAVWLWLKGEGLC